MVHQVIKKPLKHIEGVLNYERRLDPHRDQHRLTIVHAFSPKTAISEIDSLAFEKAVGDHKEEYAENMLLRNCIAYIEQQCGVTYRQSSAETYTMGIPDSKERQRNFVRNSFPSETFGESMRDHWKLTEDHGFDHDDNFEMFSGHSILTNNAGMNLYFSSSDLGMVFEMPNVPEAEEIFLDILRDKAKEVESAMARRSIQAADVQNFSDEQGRSFTAQTGRRSPIFFKNDMPVSAPSITVDPYINNEIYGMF